MVLFYFRSEWRVLTKLASKRKLQKSYAANRKMGGDIGLTLSHDLDLAKYFLEKLIML